VRNLTPLPGVKVELLSLSATDPNVVLVTVEDRTPGLPGVYRLDLRSGERTLVLQNDGRFLGWTADHAPLPRLGYTLDESGNVDVWEVVWSGKSGAAPRLELLFEIGPDDFPGLQANSAQRVARFATDNRRFFFYDSRGRDKIALVVYDFATRETTVLAEDERVDLAGVLFHPATEEPQAYSTVWTRAEWHALDAGLRGDLDRLRGATEGEVAIESRSADQRRWVVRLTTAHEPERYVLYERPTGTLHELFVATPALVGLPLARMHALELRSRDGLDLVSYLSLPPWTDRDGDGRPAEPVPLVVLVHGGPSDERARYAFGAFVHWLANRGYGVLYVNYRGSPGFGKAFVNAQRGEWGGKMHDDVIDQVEWAIDQGIAPRDRVAILGGSYGGYATLVGMTMTPEVFACGVDLVGPSSIEVFMPHWNVDVQSRILGGDPRTEEGRAFLRSRSPLHQAHRAKHPLLIGQGAHDSRVPQEQSDQMVRVLQEHGVPVTYVLYPDEGHGLVRRENVASFWAIAEGFLAQCLGGRYQPITTELEGSSAQVLAGAEHVPGLTAALAR
jgi:dipeptidyl aminopeptidase/acylaminoacyl peptidase